MSDLEDRTVILPSLPEFRYARRLRSLGEVASRCDLSDSGEQRAGRLFIALADEIERQHPPRMDEPDEFGAMVEAGTHVEGDSPRERRPLVRHQTSGTLQWSDEHGRTYAWSELVDPRPVG